MTGYQYRRGDRARDAEVQARVTAAQQQASRSGQPAQPPAPPLRPVPGVKGAVKVERFPERSKYPFRQIADDGGIWQLDPGVYEASPTAVKQAASTYAKNHGLTVKTAIDGGIVYVQFKAGA